MFNFRSLNLCRLINRSNSVILTRTIHRLYFQEWLVRRDQSYIIFNADSLKISRDFEDFLQLIRTMKQLDNCFSSLFGTDRQTVFRFISFPILLSHRFLVMSLLSSPLNNLR